MTSNSNKRCHTSDDDENVSPMKKPKMTATGSATLKLEALPDHCLLHLSSYLTPIDLIRLSGASRRLMSMVQQAFRKKTFFSGSGKEAESVSEQQLPIVLEKMGTFIHRIRWEYIGACQLSYLSAYCNKVYNLTLVAASLVYRNIETEESFFENLRTLRLVKCSTVYDNSMVKIVNTASHLKNLHLVDCPNIQGKFFGKWKRCQLSYLNIYGDGPVRRNFFTLCETDQLMRLKSLSLDCKVWNTTAEFEKLRSLANLKYLSLKNVDDQLVKWMYSSLKEYIPQIELLKMHTRNRVAVEGDSTSIFEFVSSFGNLKKFAHSMMSCELLQMICQMREIRKQPIEIGVRLAQFNDPKQIEFAAAHKHIVKLTLQEKLFL